MYFNRIQKSITIVYLILLIILFVFFTPYYANEFIPLGEKLVEDYGNFFTIDSGIFFYKFFIEIGLLSLLYLLLMIIFSKK